MNSTYLLLLVATGLAMLLQIEWLVFLLVGVFIIVLLAESLNSSPSKAPSSPTALSQASTPAQPVVIVQDAPRMPGFFDTLLGNLMTESVIQKKAGAYERGKIPSQLAAANQAKYTEFAVRMFEETKKEVARLSLEAGRLGGSYSGKTDVKKAEDAVGKALKTMGASDNDAEKAIASAKAILGMK
ncbi:hypothetical protein HY991_03725 [Candidatus Micrarchaeota archaeon]|nr:hypothetical protein [Candidatus Micrarchaeota archaeon]